MFIILFLDITIPDKRTLSFLEQYLRDTSVNQRTMRDLAINLVLKEIYQDDVTELRDKLTRLQKALRTKSSSSMETDSGHSTPIPRPISSDADKVSPLKSAGSRSRSSPVWNLPSSMDDLKTILKDKDDILRRKDDDYEKLKVVLEDTQRDMQEILDLNSQYLTIISQLNQMQMAAAATPRVSGTNSEDIEKLVGDLEEAQAKVSKLELDLMHVESDLANKESDLDRLERRQHKYIDMLGLDHTADEDDIQSQIQKIVDQGEMDKKEARKIQKELDTVRNSLNATEHQLCVLSKEKDKISFHMRQQEMTIKKINRMKAGKDVIQHSEQMLKSHGHDPRTAAQLRLPAIERPGTSLSLASNKATRAGHQYCMFCRAEFQLSKAQPCRVHFRPIRGGRWTCCRDENHRSAGCLQLTHLYVEITVDKKVFITDGARYLELT